MVIVYVLKSLDYVESGSPVYGKLASHEAGALDPGRVVDVEHGSERNQHLHNGTSNAGWAVANRFHVGFKTSFAVRCARLRRRRIAKSGYSVGQGSFAHGDESYLEPARSEFGYLLFRDHRRGRVSGNRGRNRKGK